MNLSRWENEAFAWIKHKMTLMRDQKRHQCKRLIRQRTFNPQHKILTKETSRNKGKTRQPHPPHAGSRVSGRL